MLIFCGKFIRSSTFCTRWNFCSMSYKSNDFCPWHDKPVGANENISRRTDKSITLFYSTIYRLVWWVENWTWFPCFLFICSLQRDSAQFVLLKMFLLINSIFLSPLTFFQVSGCFSCFMVWCCEFWLHKISPVMCLTRRQLELKEQFLQSRIFVCPLKCVPSWSHVSWATNYKMFFYHLVVCSETATRKNLSIWVLSFFPKLSTLSSLVAISVVKMEIKFFKLSRDPVKLSA